MFRLEESASRKQNSRNNPHNVKYFLQKNLNQPKTKQGAKDFSFSIGKTSDLYFSLKKSKQSIRQKPTATDKKRKIENDNNYKKNSELYGYLKLKQEKKKLFTIKDNKNKIHISLGLSRDVTPDRASFRDEAGRVTERKKDINKYKDKYSKLKIERVSTEKKHPRVQSMKKIQSFSKKRKSRDSYSSRKRKLSNKYNVNVNVNVYSNSRDYSKDFEEKVNQRKNSFSQKNVFSPKRKKITNIKWISETWPDVLSEIHFSDILGQGSFAKVYEALDKKLGQPVAVKVLNKRKLNDKKRRRLVEYEVRILGRMQHPNIGSMLRLLEDQKRVKNSF